MAQCRTPPRNLFMGQEKEKCHCALLSILLSKNKATSCIYNINHTLRLKYILLYETKFFCQSTDIIVSRLMCQL